MPKIFGYFLCRFEKISELCIIIIVIKTAKIFSIQQYLSHKLVSLFPKEKRHLNPIKYYNKPG